MEIELGISQRDKDKLRKVLEKDYAANREWCKVMYTPDACERWPMRYSRRFDASALRRLVMMLCFDRSAGLERAVQYFCDVFDIKFRVPISFIIPHGAVVSTMAHNICIDMATLKIKDPCLVVRKQFLDYANPFELLGIIAHEMWHVHQNVEAVRWCRRNGTAIDLETVQPNEFESCGAVYIMAFATYIPAEEDFKAYEQQLIESEANYVKFAVEKLIRV